MLERTHIVAAEALPQCAARACLDGLVARRADGGSLRAGKLQPIGAVLFGQAQDAQRRGVALLRRGFGLDHVIYQCAGVCADRSAPVDIGLNYA